MYTKVYTYMYLCKYTYTLSFSSSLSCAFSFFLSPPLLFLARSLSLSFSLSIKRLITHEPKDGRQSLPTEGDRQHHLQACLSQPTQPLTYGGVRRKGTGGWESIGRRCDILVTNCCHKPLSACEGAMIRTKTHRTWVLTTFRDRWWWRITMSDRALTNLPLRAVNPTSSRRHLPRWTSRKLPL